jgi:hypothetical protein
MVIGNRPVGFALDPGFMLAVAAGQIPGWSVVRKFGQNPAIQAAVPADIWEYGVTLGAEKYTFSADGVADIDTVSSSSAADTVIQITVQGLDINGNESSEDVILNGQNKVPLVTPLWRVNRMFNSNATATAGNVYCYVDGAITDGVPNDDTTVRGYFSIAEQQTLQAIYTIPNGKRGYIVGREISLFKVGGASASADITVQAKEFGKVRRTQAQFDLISTGSSVSNYNPPAPAPQPGKTDIIPSALVSANNIGITAAYTILLEDIT